MTFRDYYEEKFSFEKRSGVSNWRKVGSNWMYSFAYDTKNNTVGPIKSDSFDTYYIMLEKANGYDKQSVLCDFSQTYPTLVKNEAYYWVQFESNAIGSGIASKETGIHRNARAIIQTVISALFQKISPSDNICFTANADQPSRISLYGLLAKMYAKKVNKKVDTKEYESEMYFLVH